MLFNKNSSYIRRDYSELQEVSTPLSFKKALTIKEPINDNNPATKGYVNQKLRETVDSLNTIVPQLETIKKIKMTFQTIGSGGTSGYSGIGCMSFVDSQGSLIGGLAAYSFQQPNPVTSLSTSIITQNPAIVWLGKQQTGSNLIKSIRQITSTPTEDDLQFLNGLENPIRVYIKVHSWPFISNFYDWLVLPKLFQLVQSNAFQGNQLTTGILPTVNTPLSFSWWIEDTASISNFLTYCTNVVFQSFASASSTIYVTPCVRITLTLNDEYIVFDTIMNELTTEGDLQIAYPTLNKGLVSINMTEDESNNNVKLQQLGLYINPSQELWGSIIYNNTTKKYEKVMH